MLGLNVRDFKLLTPSEILKAGKKKMELWHLTNAVNANFFTSIHSALGTKSQTGGLVRTDLYIMPGEEHERDYLDPNTEEGLKEIKRRIALA